MHAAGSAAASSGAAHCSSHTAPAAFHLIQLSDCTAYRRLLTSASNPKRTPGDDICNRPPFTCDSKGRLLRFPAPHAGFNCQGDLRPWAAFTELIHLDLSSNALDATTEAVAALVSKLPKLKRLHMLFARMSGQMTCDLIGPEMRVRPTSGARACRGCICVGAWCRSMCRSMWWL